MTHILGELVKLFLKFCVFITRKVGINGILFLILILELPAMYFYYSNTRYEYLQGHEYNILEGNGIRKLSPEKDHLEQMGVSVKKSESYYLAELQVDNLYSNEIRYLSLSASNQNGDVIDCRTMGYYDASGNEGQEVIPAGVTGTLSCIITLTEEEIQQTDEIVLEGWAIGESENSYTVIIDFTSMKT